MVLAPAAPRPPLGPAVALPLVISTPHQHHPLSTPHGDGGAGDGGAGEPAHAAVDTRRARPAGCEPSRRQAALSARRAKGRPSGRRAPPAGGPPAMTFLVAQRTALRRRAARAAEGTCTERRRETRATWQLGGRAAAGRGRRCRSREREGRCPRRDVSSRTQRHWKPAQLLEIWLNLPARIKMVEPHYVMHGADPVPESSSARSRAGGRAAPELTRPTAPPPPPTKERGGYGPAFIMRNTTTFPFPSKQLSYKMSSPNCSSAYNHGEKKFKRVCFEAEKHAVRCIIFQAQHLAE